MRLDRGLFVSVAPSPALSIWHKEDVKTTKPLFFFFLPPLGCLGDAEAEPALSFGEVKHMMSLSLSLSLGRVK